MIGLEAAFLARVAALLERLRIPYMVTGSVASSHHGRPRATHDADFIIDPEASALSALVTELTAAGCYVPATAAREALRRRHQFNVIDTESGLKLDLIIRKDRPFSVEELRRRVFAEIDAGVRVSLATPEDTILSKLEWAKKAGGSEKQLADAAGIVEVRGAALDRAYIERWARALGVLALWRQIDRPRPRRKR